MVKISIIFYLESGKLDLLAFSDESPIYCRRRFDFDIKNPTVRDVYNFISCDEDVTDFLSTNCGENYIVVRLESASDLGVIKLN